MRLARRWSSKSWPYASRAKRGTGSPALKYMRFGHYSRMCRSNASNTGSASPCRAYTHRSPRRSRL